MTHEKEKLPEKEESKQESVQEGQEIDEKAVIAADKEGQEIDEKAVIAADKEGKVREGKTSTEQLSEKWKPLSRLGRQVKNGEITDISVIITKGFPIFEVEIVDMLIPELQSELLLIGQAKGKFGGGQRRVFRQTQKKTREGNKPSFTACAVVGNSNGYVGVGFGKSKETVPSREKAVRRAKLNILKIRRGSGSWEDTAAGTHSIPFAVEGKCGSVKLKLIPAPKGAGLVIEKECAKILRLAGINDIRSKTSGKTKTKSNLIRACVDALQKLSKINVRERDVARLSLCEGRITGERS